MERMLPWTGLLIVALLLCAAGCEPSDSARDTQPAPPSADEPPAAAPTASPQQSTPPPQSSLPDEPPPSLRSVETTPGPPRIVFDSMEIHFGTMSETEERVGRFFFLNGGGERLVISDVKATCGCTVVTVPQRSFEPGEIGHLDIAFDPTAPGEQRKFVNVVTNAQPQAVARLVVRADVQTFIAFEPRMVSLDVLEYGQPHRVEVLVSSPAHDPRITSIATSNPLIEARRADQRSPNDGTTIEIRVPADAPWGPLFTWLIVTMEGRVAPDAAPISHTSRIRIQGELFGDLHAGPNTFRFGVDPGETFERTVVLKRPDGRPFELRRASVASSDLIDPDLTVERRAPHEYVLTLTATGGSRQQTARGRVTVETDVPGEERVEIPIVGVVRGGR